MNLLSEINVLVSDVLDGNNYSHCRVCLKSIEDDQFVYFDDIAYSSHKRENTFFCDSTPEECLPLSQVLSKIFGQEVCDKIEGLDAVCSGCLTKILDMYGFIQQYEANTRKLYKVLENLFTTLDNDIGMPNKDYALYIKCHEDVSPLIFVQKKEKREGKKTPNKKVIFKCTSCKENFIDLELLVQHNKDQHSLFTCEKCTYTSTNLNYVSEHATSNMFYKCDNCPQLQCTEESLNEHKSRIHGLYVCKECGKSFRGLDKLLLHEQKHSMKNVCPKCGKTYRTKEFFKKHRELCLENRVEPHPMRSRIVKTYFCDKCNKGYSTRGGLRVHQRFEHGDAEHHVCNQCGKKFTAPCYLKSHMVTHTKEKNFPCDLCPGRFVTKEALLYHRRRHTGEKPYSCDQCGERFVNASARVEHIKFKHIGPTLSCEICSRKFVTKNILRIHMKHHNEPSNKLYICRAVVPHSETPEQNVNIICTSNSEE